ncbi:heterokaryon incompatibility [Schizothecium vesticola]|uniref:Heterokaryon incompatibility n=1 Tax=Schizothecium vesticola TaxID=314040 RepID=A0AA40ER23_9PEZI|nr:heterokaryon incompatibility [Schizothecium vesticola]
MKVTEQLGLRFLWADALCIVQDDQPMKEFMIPLMGGIYGKAVLTIVAVSGGHANAGLSGWGGKDILKWIENVVRAGAMTLGVLPDVEEDLKRSPYVKRAWTYQEGCLSARCVIFLNSYAYFHYHESL